MKCFDCNGVASKILRNFWLGMSFMPSVYACSDCVKEIKRSVKRIVIEDIKPDHLRPGYRGYLKK